MTPEPTTPPQLTDEQKHQLRAWHEARGYECVAASEGQRCCVELMESRGTMPDDPPPATTLDKTPMTTERGKPVNDKDAQAERLSAEERRADIGRRLPEFIKAIERVRAGEVEMIVMTIGAFAPVEDAELLHAALHVAYEEGVAVTFAPKLDADNPL